MSWQQLANRTTADTYSPADINQVEENVELLKGGDPAVAPTKTVEELAVSVASLITAITPSATIVMTGASSAPTSWLLCNGDTIGDTGSGATHAGAEYEDLFEAIKGSGYGNTGAEVWSDGDTVKVPDMRGVFPRAAGANGTLTDANGTPFSATLGQGENDKVQGHYHGYESKYTGVVNGTYYGNDDLSSPSGGIPHNDRIKAPISDGSNGTPRTGTYTQPAAVVVNFIIKV